MEEYRMRIGEKESEITQARADLDRQKQEASKSPSQEMKALVERLRAQLAEKEDQQHKLNAALNDLKGDMVEMAKTNVTSLSGEAAQEKRLRDLVEKTSGEYQDKLIKASEELATVRKELNKAIKDNEELRLEIGYVKSQMSTFVNDF